MGGKHLDDVVCPNCAGHHSESQTGPTWTVGCSTCDWVYQPWSAEDRIEDGKAARSTADDHACEPEVWIRVEGIEGDFGASDIDREGNLKADAIEREAQAAALMRERAS
jgi:rubredoxin